MARLDATRRADLPDRAFAYVDSRGRRRLPINDEAHVRNALARFGQVKFEDEHARERARKRLLNAAKKFGIVPVGFITGQLETERRREPEPVATPSGFVTMLMTDIEGSTALVHRLGDGYSELIADDVYPKIWHDPRSLDYLRESYEALAAFFHAAAAEGDSVLIWMS